MKHLSYFSACNQPQQPSHEMKTPNLIAASRVDILSSSRHPRAEKRLLALSTIFPNSTNMHYPAPNYFTCTLGQAYLLKRDAQSLPSFKTITDMLDEQASRLPDVPALGLAACTEETEITHGNLPFLLARSTWRSGGNQLNSDRFSTHNVSPFTRSLGTRSPGIAATPELAQPNNCAAIY